MNESMRVEWGKAKARVDRWQEEVELLVEEMRRVLAYFDWKRTDWEAKAEARKGPRDLESGLKGYAYRQSDMFCRMVTSFAQSWGPILKANRISCEWATRRERVTMEEMEIDDEQQDDELGDVLEAQGELGIEHELMSASDEEMLSFP